MNTFIVMLFACSLASFLGMVHYLISMQKPGIYPPKRLLMRRARVLGSGGAFFLLIGVIFFLLAG